MIVVVEGTKQSGKTSMIKRFKEILPKELALSFYDRDLFKYSLNYADAVFANCLSYLNAAIEIDKAFDGKPLIFFDRFHISELVYGDKVRGYKNDKMWIIDEKLRRVGAKGIMFLSDTAEKRTGVKVYKDEFYDYAKQSALDWMVINLDNVKGKFGDGLIVKIADYIEGRVNNG